MRKFLGLLIFTLIFLVSVKSVFAKDYYFPRVEATYNINADGSIDVVEKRTYSFDGSFSWADLKSSLTVDRKGYRYDASIKNFKILENDQVIYSGVDQKGGTYYAKWDYSAFNQTRKFDISYTLADATGGGVDFDEFYWQVIGDSWEKRTENARFLVTFPSEIPRDKVYVFAHGPLNGKFDFVKDNKVNFEVSDVPPKKFVEVRLIFPKGTITSASSSNKTLNDVFNEEKITKIKNRFIFGIGIATLALNLGWIIYWFFAWLKFGKEFRKSDVPKYLHEPPSDLSPALVDLLLSQGNRVSPNSLAAMILDFARRKYIKIEGRRVLKKVLIFTNQEWEYSIAFQKTIQEIEKDKKLLNFEKAWLKEIYYLERYLTQEEAIGYGLPQKKPVVKLDDLKARMKRPDFYKIWLLIQSDIKREGRKRGFLEEGSIARNTYFILSLVVILVLNALTIFFLSYSGLLPLVIINLIISLGIFSVWIVVVLLRLIFFSGVIKKFPLGNLIFFMKRWSLAYGFEAQKWQAFKNFMEEFAHFKDTLPNMLPIWEKYLVFGALFGQTKKILELMPQILGEKTPSWYVSSGGGYSSSFSGFSSGFSNFSASLSAGVTAGAGGSFSGGGGGGGGGSGAG